MDSTIISTVLLEGVLPYLGRSDWNSFCVVNKEIYIRAKESKAVTPPWPNNCTIMEGTNRVDPQWSPDGKQIACVQNQGLMLVVLKIFDCKDGLIHAHEVHWDRIRSLLYTPNGRFLVTAGMDGYLTIWDVKKGYQPIKEFKVLTTWSSGDHLLSGTYSVAVSPCSERVAVLEERRVFVVRIVDGEVLFSKPLQDFVSPSNLLYTADGESLVFAGGLLLNNHFYRGVIFMWKPKTTKLVSIEENRANNNNSSWCVQRVAVSPDGSKLLTTSLRGSSGRLWNLNAGETHMDDGGLISFSQQLWKGPPFQFMAFTPDSKAIVGRVWTRGRRPVPGNVRILTLCGMETRELPIVLGRAFSISFSPQEGNRILVGEPYEGSTHVKTIPWKEEDPKAEPGVSEDH